MKMDIGIRIKIDEGKLRYLLEDIEELKEKLSMAQNRLKEILETAEVSLIDDC